ncbi:meckelin-like [Pseudonaja textilis]|uniref:meckelin-like n=1 Tax=Pseudonaja textilis TaxID=8673 RepID=UPI000EA96FD9|nr:meckelin-like [Pseudonaja textilis]
MPMLNHSVLLLLLLLLRLLNPLQGSSVLGLRNERAPTSLPEKCAADKFFSLETGQCSACAPELIRSPEGLSCVCKTGSKESSGEPHRLSCPDCSSVATGTLWESEFLDWSFLACENPCNATACQMLTNMVILRAFSLQTRPYDLYTKAKSQDLPKLWYGSNTRPFPSVAFGKHSKVDFKVIQYDAQGKFLGWQDVKGGTLQLCPNSQKILDAAFTMGTTYRQSCALEVTALLQRTPEPIFYEMFLQFEDEKGKTQLWPIPISNPAIVTNNRAPPLNQALRRFFLIDGLSDRKGNLSNAPSSVTLAKELLLSVHLPTTAPGEDPPFFLTVRYATRRIPGIAQVSFSVSYNQSPGSAQLATDISFGVLGFLAVLYALMETSSWARRSRLQNIDFTTILKFLACLVGSLANVFFMVTLGTSIYWLIAFKGQQFSTMTITLPAAGSQAETNFIIYVLCALTLKSLDLLHLLITQLAISIFLIDWEKPKEKPATKGGPASSVSAWRTFLIANEWNEIQTHRKVHPSLQLFAVLLLLEVVGFKNLASRDLNVSLHPEPNTYQAPWSPILRFGIAASVWLVVAIVQMLVSVGLYQRFVEDKIHQFIDLCSLSNVSVFILTHRCYGFYIHGRSIHGHAEVSLDTMLSYLRKEEDNLCPLRGLEPNSEVQTFEVLLTDRTRMFYDRILLSLMEHQRGLHSRPDLHEQRMKGYHALNWFLVCFLEHRYNDMDYIVKDKFFSERIMDLEFQDQADVSVLYNDDGALFSRTLFYGHEMLLLLFETLLFCAVDLGTQDFVLSTIVTFAVQKLVQILRDALGRRNLAEKTLVDKHFLI